MSLLFPANTKLFCFGFGYCAQVLAERLGDNAASRDAASRAAVGLAGTRTRVDGPAAGPVRLAVFNGDGRATRVTALLAETTHLLVSIPPDLEGDAALRYHGADLARLSSLRWIGYLSTIGVYGDAGGGTVDETSALKPQSERALRRVTAENQWRAFGQETGKRVEVFRLPGIYGPGRSVVDSLRAGTARRIIKPGQVFNRVHVVDIARALERTMALASADQAIGYDTFNVVDDEPAPPQDVVAYAAELLGLPAPPEVPFEAASLSPMGRSFYGESKRVGNARLKQALGFELQYPTYREGLLAIVRGT